MNMYIYIYMYMYVYVEGNVYIKGIHIFILRFKKSFYSFKIINYEYFWEEILNFPLQKDDKESLYSWKIWV